MRGEESHIKDLIKEASGEIPGVFLAHASNTDNSVVAFGENYSITYDKAVEKGFPNPVLSFEPNPSIQWSYATSDKC